MPRLGSRLIRIGWILRVSGHRLNMELGMQDIAFLEDLHGFLSCGPVHTGEGSTAEEVALLSVHHVGRDASEEQMEDDSLSALLGDACASQFHTLTQCGPGELVKDELAVGIES